MNTPADSDIEDQMSTALDHAAQGYQAYPAMSYEDGVVATIRWMRGETDDKPMDD